MIIKTFLITVSRALGIVLIFIYTAGTTLVFVGVITATSYLANITCIAFLSWPITIAEKQYIEEDIKEDKTHTEEK